MPLTRLDTFLIRLLYAMAALIVVFQVLNRDAVVSLLFYASFVVVLALWLSAAFRKMALLDALVLTTIALALIHVLINAIATDASLSFQYLKKYIIFAFTLLMFSAADKLRVDADTGRWISRVMALSSAVLVAMYFWKGRELYEIHGRISNYLTFHFTNPNLTGLFLFCLAVYQFADALYGRDRKLQIVHGVLFAFLAYFIWKTQSRNALLVLIAFFGAGSGFVPAQETDGGCWQGLLRPYGGVAAAVCVAVYAALRQQCGGACAGLCGQRGQAAQFPHKNVELCHAALSGIANRRGV